MKVTVRYLAQVPDKEFSGVRMLTVYPQKAEGASPEIVFHNAQGSHWEKLEEIYTITIIEKEVIV